MKIKSINQTSNIAIIALLTSILVVILIISSIILFKRNQNTPSTNNQMNSNELFFRTIEKNANNQLTERTTKVIKSQTAWQALWEALSITDGPTPAVDFNAKMIIAIFQGQKGTGGYEIEVTKILERENYIEVFAKETSPGVNCGADAVITSPYHIVELNKSDKEVTFTFEQKITNC